MGKYFRKKHANFKSLSERVIVA